MQLIAQASVTSDDSFAPQIASEEPPGVRRRNQTGFCSKPLPAGLLGSARRPLAARLPAEGTEASLPATESAIARSA